jgi:hypothetical protein
MFTRIDRFLWDVTILFVTVLLLMLIGPLVIVAIGIEECCRLCFDAERFDLGRREDNKD